MVQREQENEQTKARLHALMTEPNFGQPVEQVAEVQSPYIPPTPTPSQRIVNTTQLNYNPPINEIKKESKIVKIFKGVIMLWQIACLFFITASGQVLSNQYNIPYLVYVFLTIQILSVVALFFFLTKKKEVKNGRTG